MKTVSEQSEVPTPRWLRGPWRYVLAILGVALFFTPAIARLAGVYPTAVENRPLVKLPSLSEGFGIFPGLTQWSIDHLPLRNLAIRADAHISEDLFGQPPSYTTAGGPIGLGQSASLQGGRAGATASGPANQIVPGRNGWLFLGDEFTSGCHPQLPLNQVTSGLRRLDQIVTASGRKLVVLIPPDKDTVDDRFAPSTVIDGACARRGKALRWAAFGSLNLHDYVDMLPLLQAEEAKTRRPAYLAIDSHWTDRTAATVFLPAILNALSPRLYRSAHVGPGPPDHYTGDLSVLAGSPRTATQTSWSATRPRVIPGHTTVVSPFANFPITHYINSAPPGVPLVRGRTLLYGDSFTERSLGIIAPFFSDLVRIPELSRAAVAGPQARAAGLALLTAQIKQADVVVVEQTERIVTASTTGSILDPDVINAIQKVLATAPRGHGLTVR
jgi:hypothetical protein